MPTFRDFMEVSLYAPERGYYHHRIPSEDFYTAPELHAAFAGVLAGEVASRFSELDERRVPGPYCIVEMGSGAGVLMRTMLRSLRERHPQWLSRTTAVLVERCKPQLIESVLTAGRPDMRVLGYERLEDVPPCSGVFLSNELVDAFPVHLLQKQGGLVREVHVREEAGKPVEYMDELSSPELAAHADTIGPCLPEGGRHAVNLEALRWMRTVSKVMTAGTLITIDYGKRFGPQSPNAPRSYYRHAVDDSDLTARPFQQDLTAPVDFEALIVEGARCGLALESYGPMGRFLLERGILEWMPAAGDAFDLESYKQRNRIKTLFHPEGMGESFKTLIQTKLP